MRVGRTVFVSLPAHAVVVLGVVNFFCVRIVLRSSLRRVGTALVGRGKRYSGVGHCRRRVWGGISIFSAPLKQARSQPANIVLVHTWYPRFICKTPRTKVLANPPPLHPPPLPRVARKRPPS